MVDYKLELVFVPVSDVDRSKAFYGETLGWPVDYDERPYEGLRFIQVTPPGSACSIAFGEGIVDAPAGSVPGLQVVVSSAQEAHDELAARGVAVSDLDPQSWGIFVNFQDPDGNRWTIQELPARG